MRRKPTRPVLPVLEGRGVLWTAAQRAIRMENTALPRLEQARLMKRDLVLALRDPVAASRTARQHRPALVPATVRDIAKIVDLPPATVGRIIKQSKPINIGDVVDILWCRRQQWYGYDGPWDARHGFEGWTIMSISNGLATIQFEDYRDDRRWTIPVTHLRQADKGSR